jgi:hypothetical protein
MSTSKRNTPSVENYGHGGKGGTSNTAYPDNLGGGTAPSAGDSVATSQKLSEAEAAAAMKSYDKGAEASTS